MKPCVVLLLAVSLQAQQSPAPCRPPSCATVHEGETVSIAPAELCARSPEICRQVNDEPFKFIRPKATFWSAGDADAPYPLRTSYEVWHDRTWRTTQAIWLGAIIYDVELTHAGLAHRRCVEGNRNLSQHPSRQGLYLSNLPEYAVGTGFNWLMLKFVGKPLIFVVPTMGSVEHIRGGTSWLTGCW